jgi:hypothetical protein
MKKGLILTLIAIMCAAVMLPRSCVLDSLRLFTEEKCPDLSTSMALSDSHIYGKRVFKSLTDKGMMKNASVDVAEYFEESKRLTKENGMQKYAKVPMKYDGNSQAYMILLDLLEPDKMMGFCPMSELKNSRSTMEMSVSLTVDHMGTAVSDDAKLATRLKFKESAEMELQYDSLANYLEKSLKECKNETKKNASGSRYVDDDDFTMNEYSIKKPIKIYMMNRLLHVEIIKKNKVKADLFEDYSTKKYLMRIEHFERVIHLLRVFKTVPNVVHSFKSLDDPNKFTEGFIKRVLAIGVKYPHEVPSFLKASKQMIFLDQDKSSIIGGTPTSFYREGIDNVRLEQAEKIKDYVTSHITDYKESINFLNIYKSLAHPDIKTDDMFEQIFGARESNLIDDKVAHRFRGSLIRDISKSLMSQGFRPRFQRIDKESPLGREIEIASQGNRLTQSKLGDYSHIHFSNLRFELLDGFAESCGYVSKVSNKSSSLPIESVMKTPSEINISNKFSANTSKDLGLGNINDYISSFKGTDELDLTKSSEKFKRVVKMFEMKEEELGRDMTSEELAEFVDENIGDMYLVMTEPKLLEVHKENSRVFYMAQQSLKSVQQHFERISKKLSSKQNGVSITMNYIQRRAEIEDMAHSHTGMGKKGHPGLADDILKSDISSEDFWVAFLSFDMSEFSKKFPDKLIKIYGGIIADLTGESWLSRPDIIFKACVVAHNTRGYTGAISGILGGFEGFLNFMWTSIHSVVMSIALEQTGNKAMVSTYSDDGLGRTLYGKSSDPFRDLMKIQEVYKEHGLVFHVTKTVYSPDIWEYLGTMCVEGMIVDEWCKSYFKIGLDKTKQGFTPVMDIITSIDSQGVATVNHGAPPELVKYTVTNYVVNYLTNRFEYMDKKIIGFMSMIPSSCSGLGLTSIGKLHLNSQTTSLAEFASDLELMSYYNPSVSSTISRTVIENLKDKDEAIKGAMNGSILQTNISSSSGDSIIRGLIRKANSKCGTDMPDNPFTEAETLGLVKVAKNAKKINLKTFQRLLIETPNAKRYAAARIGMTSSASIQLLGKDTVKRAQKSDTKNFDRCYQFWDEKLRHCKGEEIYTSREFLDMTINMLYPDIKTTIMKESHRTYLKISSQESCDIKCEVMLPKGVNITKHKYYEPVKRFIAPITPAITMSESVDNFEQRMAAKFAIFGARMLSSEPRSLGLYVGVCNALGIRTGFPPVGMLTSLHRSASASFGRSDVTTSIPTLFMATIASSITKKLYDNIEGRGDRTSPCQAAISCSYHNHSAFIDENGINLKDSAEYYYEVRNPECNVLNDSSDSHERANYALADTRLTKLITDEVQALSEYNRASVNEEGQIGLMNMIDDLGEGPVVAIMTKGMSDYLWNVCDTRVKSRSKFNISSIPRYFSVTIISNAIHDVSYNMSPRITKNDLIRIVSKYESICTPGEVGESDSLDILRGYAKDVFDKDDSYLSNIEIVMSVVRSLGYDESITSLFNDSYVSSDAFCQSLIRTVQKFDRVSNEKVPVAVMALNTGLSRQFTSSHKKVVSDAIDYLLRKEEYGFGSMMMESFHGILEYLSMASAKDSLRQSKHRVTHYNNVAVQARTLRAYNLLMKCVVTDLNDHDDYYNFAQSYIISDDDIERLTSNWTIMRDQRRTDIQGILKSVNDGTVIKSVWSVIKFHRKGGTLGDIMISGIRKCRSLQSMINGSLTDYDRKIHSKISNSIVTIDVHYLKALDSDAYLSQKDLVSLSRASYSEPSVRGRVIDAKHYFSDIKGRDVLNSLSILRSMTYSVWKESEVEISRDESRLMRDREGRIVEAGLHGTDARVSVREHDFLAEAMDVWAYVNSLPDGVSYIIKKRDCYVTINMSNNAEQGGEKYKVSFADDSEFVTTDMITYTEGGLVEDIEKHSRMKQDGKRGKVTGIQALISSEAFTAASGSRVTVMNSEVALTAIGAGVSGTWDMENSLVTYLAVRAWMFSEDGNNVNEVLGNFQKEVDDFEDYLVDNEGTLPKSVTSDISMTWQWVKKSGFSPGSKVDSRLVAGIAKIFLSQEFDIRVPTTLTTSRPLPFSAVKQGLGSIRDIEYGKVSDYLFTRTRVGKKGGKYLKGKRLDKSDIDRLLLDLDQYKK